MFDRYEWIGAATPYHLAKHIQAGQFSTDTRGSIAARLFGGCFALNLAIERVFNQELVLVLILIAHLPLSCSQYPKKDSTTVNIVTSSL